MAFYTRTAAGVSYVLMKEDISNMITNIDPDETPILSSMGVIPMNGMPHYENVDTLAPRNANNAQPEGADAPGVTDTTPTQSFNYPQIFSKTAEVGGSLEARKSYGVGSSQLTYQVAKKGKELKNDAEAANVSANARVAPAGAATAGKMDGLATIIATNVDSTTTTFTSPNAFNALLEQTFEAGGKPTQVYLSGARKRDVSEKWTTNISRQENKSLQELVEVVDIYLSDFGRMFMNFHWMLPDTTVLALQPDMFKRAVPSGREAFIQDLATVGDKKSKQIIMEYTIASKQEKASMRFSALT